VENNTFFPDYTHMQKWPVVKHRATNVSIFHAGIRWWKQSH